MTKLAAEHLCAQYHGNFGVQTVVLRYFSVYGPRQRPDMAFNSFRRAALEGTPIDVFGDGLQTRDFTYVADVVAATRAAATAPDAIGGTYNIGGGSQVALRDAIAALEEIGGRQLEARLLAPQRGDVRDTAADTSAAVRDIGFRPRVTLEEGLRAQFEWAEAALRLAGR